MSAKRTKEDRSGPSVAQATEATSLLDEVEAPRDAAAVTLASGRRYELESGEEADRLVIRGKRGEVVLRVEITDRGPLLSFSSAEIELSASRRIALAAPELALSARGDITLEAGGSLRERVAGDHHTEVGGQERLEATSIEMQASRGHIEVLANQAVNIDGEHIGLNDKRAPTPFSWSKPGREEP